MTDAGSEFQTDGAAHRKERFAKSVRANGWMSSGVAVERSVRALTRRLMRWLRYRGADVFRVMNVIMSTQTPCSQFCIEPVVDASAVWHGTASVPAWSRACERSVSGAENGAERAKNRLKRSGAGAGGRRNGNGAVSGYPVNAAER